MTSPAEVYNGRLRTSSIKALQARYERQARRTLRRLPSLEGTLPRIEAAPGLRDPRGPVHAGSFLRERRIAFDCSPAEFPRIFVHELFHFVWLRAGNPVRRSFEELVKRELSRGVRGELGWSSEWRKQALSRADIAGRTRRWREYCCESFCDTAAWLYSGVAHHEEFTLAARFRGARRRWFKVTIATRGLSV